MKNFILSVASICMTGIAFGQQWTTSGNNIYNSNTGNVGIGLVSNYNQKLTVNGDIGFDNITTGGYYRSILGNNTPYGLLLYANSAFSNGSGIILDADGSASPGKITMISGGATSPTTKALELLQYNNNTYSSRFSVYKDGRFQIGTKSSTGAVLTVQGNAQGTYMDLYNSADVDWNTQIRFGKTDGTIQHIITTQPSLNGGSLTFIPGWNGNGSNRIVVQGGFLIYDKVILGDNNTPTPGSYRLYVKDGILTEKVRVAVQGTTNWADHVFADNYDLKPLHEVEGFIKENKHLPEIPSANDVVKDGVDLGAMDAKLLQKIEELTLYVIQQQKEIEQLKKQIK